MKDCALDCCPVEAKRAALCEAMAKCPLNGIIHSRILVTCPFPNCKKTLGWIMNQSGIDREMTRAEIWGEAD